MTDADLERAACRWVLGLSDYRELTDVASTALAEGWDSPALRNLAALSVDEAVDAGGLLKEAVATSSAQWPTPTEAVLSLAREIGHAILDGSVTPDDGAARIWKLTLLVDPDDGLHSLDTFVYAASEYEERPRDRPSFDAAVLAAAADLIAPERREQAEH